MIGCIVDLEIMSMGFVDIFEGQYCIAQIYDAGKMRTKADQLGYFIVASGKSQNAILKSFDTDGFILTWVKNGDPTGTAYFTCLCLK